MVKYDKGMIQTLAESWCPNDMNIEDCSFDENGVSRCHGDVVDCEECWIESLDKLERRNGL